MTDGDIFHRHPAKAWNASWKLLAGGHPPAAVAAAADKALAATLRQNGGLPRADAFAGIVQAVFDREVNLPQAFDEISQLVREGHGSKQVRLAADACERLVLEAREQPASIGLDVVRALTERFLLVTVDNQLFGRIRPELQDRQFGDPREAKGFEEPYRQELAPRVRRLAERLASDPTVIQPGRMRASAFRRPTTRAVLNEVLA